MIFPVIVFSDPSCFLLVFFNPIEVFKKPKPNLELVIQFKLCMSHFILSSPAPLLLNQPFENFDPQVSCIGFISVFKLIKIPIKPPKEYF